MDPITLNKLLSVADGVDEHRTNDRLQFSVFYEIVRGQGQVKHLERRVKDILRVFKATGWFTGASPDFDTLYLTQRFHEFIGSWDSGEHLLPMNQGLANYPPYASFLDFLEKERKVEIPRRDNKESREELKRTLKENNGLTFVAFDTFRAWAVAVGHAYLSPFDRYLYWGGDWNLEEPSLESFKLICKMSYCQSEKTSGYANLGRVAHLVCLKLNISFQAFELKINQFVEAFPGEVRLAPATIRREVSGRFRVTNVRSRGDVMRERLYAKLQGSDPPPSKWIEYRYLEDGMRVRGKLVKLIRWEESE